MSIRRDSSGQKTEVVGDYKNVNTVRSNVKDLKIP